MAKSSSSALSSWFSDPNAETAQLVRLFEYLPRAYLFIKDVKGHFVHANHSFLVLHGCKSHAELQGKTDYDFHPPALASQYVDEDQRVMASREPLPDQVWLVMGYDQMPRWYVSTKMPLFDSKRQLVGIGGIMRLYDHAGSFWPITGGASPWPASQKSPTSRSVNSSASFSASSA